MQERHQVKCRIVQVIEIDGTQDGKIQPKDFVSPQQGWKS
jgi:hypothetical protein